MVNDLCRGWVAGVKRKLVQYEWAGKIHTLAENGKNLITAELENNGDDVCFMFGYREVGHTTYVRLDMPISIIKNMVRLMGGEE